MSSTPRQQPPTWAALAEARKLLAPADPQVADLSDDDLLAAYALAMHDAGKLGVPTGDAVHDTALTVLEARLRTMSDAELARMRRTALDVLRTRRTPEPTS